MLLSPSGIGRSFVSFFLLVLVIISPTKLRGRATSTCRYGRLIWLKDNFAKCSKSYLQGSIANISNVLKFPHKFIKE